MAGVLTMMFVGALVIHIDLWMIFSEVNKIRRLLEERKDGIH